MRITSSRPIGIEGLNVAAAPLAKRIDDGVISYGQEDEDLSCQSSLSVVSHSNDECDDLDFLALSVAGSPMQSTPLCSTPLQSPSGVAMKSASLLLEQQRSSISRREHARSMALLRKYLASEPAPRYGFLSQVQEGGISSLDRAEMLLWLQELIEFHECDDGVFVCSAALLDRLLSSTKMKAKHLRVAAVACFLIASKCLMEEADQPLVSDLVANCREFSANDLKRMELVVLDKLGWEVPSTSFLDMLQDLHVFAVHEIQLDSFRAQDVIDAAKRDFVACTVSYELLRFKPSVVAASLLIKELCCATAFTAGFLRHTFASELGIDAKDIECCDSFVGRHLKATAALFASANRTSSA